MSAHNVDLETVNGTTNLWKWMHSIASITGWYSMEFGGVWNIASTEEMWNMASNPGLPTIVITNIQLTICDEHQVVRNICTHLKNIEQC